MKCRPESCGHLIIDHNVGRIDRYISDEYMDVNIGRKFKEKSNMIYESDILFTFAKN